MEFWWNNLIGSGYSRERRMGYFRQKVNDVLQRQGNINELDDYGRTLLMECAKEGDYQTVNKLLEKGANPFIKDIYGHSAFSEAAFSSYHNNSDYIKTLELLLKAGVKVNSRLGVTKSTALLDVCLNQPFDDVIEFLLLNGANPLLTDINGTTVFRNAYLSNPVDHERADYQLTRGELMLIEASKKWTELEEQISKELQDEEYVRIKQENMKRMAYQKAQRNSSTRTKPFGSSYGSLGYLSKYEQNRKNFQKRLEERLNLLNPYAGEKAIVLTKTKEK